VETKRKWGSRRRTESDVRINFIDTFLIVFGVIKI
jgi:hypothetical protein